jgi:hypothetical protein
MLGSLHFDLSQSANVSFSVVAMVSNIVTRTPCVTWICV